MATGNDLQYDKTNPVSVGTVPFQSDFENPQCVDGVCDGWDCSNVTRCGLVADPNPGFGNICGGYGKTGGTRDISRTLRGLTVGATYTFSLDVIIGDSWDGEEFSIGTRGKGVNFVKCYERHFHHLHHATGRNVCKYNTIFSPSTSHIQIDLFQSAPFRN